MTKLVPLHRPKDSNVKVAAYKRQMVQADKTKKRQEVVAIKNKAMDEKKLADRLKKQKAKKAETATGKSQGKNGKGEANDAGKKLK